MRFSWRHPVTGRHGWQPDPDLLAFGQYLKRARYLARVTQERLEELSGVPIRYVSVGTRRDQIIEV